MTKMLYSLKSEYQVQTVYYGICNISDFRRKLDTLNICMHLWTYISVFVCILLKGCTRTKKEDDTGSIL